MNRVGVYAYLLCAQIVNICIHINVECLGFDVRKMNCIDVRVFDELARSALLHDGLLFD